jgi:hypothetical protein
MKVFKYDILDDLEARQCNAIESLTEEKEIGITAHDFYESLMPYKQEAELFLVQIRYNNIDIENTIDMFRIVANCFFAECLGVQCVNGLYNSEYNFNRKNFSELYAEANEAETVLDNNSIISFGTHILFKIAVRKSSYSLTTKREIVNLLNFLSSIYSISIQNDNSTVTVVDYGLADSSPHKISFNAHRLYNLKRHTRLNMALIMYPFMTIYGLAQEMYTYFGLKANPDVISEIIQKWWNKYSHSKQEIYTYKELENFTITYKKNKIMANSFYGAAGVQLFDPTKIFTLTISET